MFSLSRPTPQDVERAIGQYSGLNLRPELLNSREGLRVPRLPDGFAHDVSRSKLGEGSSVFSGALQAFQRWKQFDLGWVRVSNIGASISLGQIVAVEVYALGLWSLNLSQIVDVISEADAFGFTYKTSPHHAEEGEERFLLTFDRSTEEVHYELEAVSRPQHWFPRLGYPVTRAFQHKFARDSHRRMRRAVFALPLT